MDAQRRNSAGPLALVLAFAGFGFFSIWYWGVPSADHVERTIAEKNVDEIAAGLNQGPSAFAADAIAYAEAVRDGDCETALPRVAWIQERIALLRSEGATDAGIDEEIARLCASMAERGEERPVMRAEGLPDKYIFLPDSKITVLGTDSGRAGLARPVKERVWLRVRYADPRRSPQDENGNAISGLVAGINFADDGMVLKAGVSGETEIDLDSLQYNW